MWPWVSDLTSLFSLKIGIQFPQYTIHYNYCEQQQQQKLLILVEDLAGPQGNNSKDSMIIRFKIILGLAGGRSNLPIPHMSTVRYKEGKVVIQGHTLR